MGPAKTLEVASPVMRDPVIKPRGLYIKVPPANDDEIVRSAIVIGIPEDTFGNVVLVFDGLGIEEECPVRKVSLRWQREFDWDTKVWMYRDSVSGELKTKQPLVPKQEEAMWRIINARKAQYKEEKERQANLKRLQSCIAVQCAWRCYKARQTYAKAQDLRAREKIREQEVDAVAKEMRKKKSSFLYRRFKSKR